MNDKFNLRAEYSALHKQYPMGQRRPIIGITANYKSDECLATLAEGYYSSVLAAGCSPVIIPPYGNREALIELLSTLDGIVLSGGADIDPRYMGEEPDYDILHTINPTRDEQELMLALLAVDRGLPILGICRGIQTLAAALGGSVHQDIYNALGNELLNHDQSEERSVATHWVNIGEGSRLAAIFGSDRLFVNTFHHQAVNRVPQGFAVTAVAPDGVIEAMEAVDGRSIIGVQWHPETFILKDDNRCMMPLFRWLADEAQLYRAAKEVHAKILSIDSHCDTPMLFGEGYLLQERSTRALVDLHKMNEGALDVVTMVAYLKQEARDAVSLAAATEKASALLQGIEERVAANSSHVAITDTPCDLWRLKNDGKKVIMLGIENGYAIGSDIANIEKFRNRGVVYMTLCHNGDNDICDSARGNSEHGGLSEFGYKVVAEMNRVGMLIDLSHAAESTFYAVLRASTQPVVCSHSSCRALCDHARNLTDEQLRALAANGGVAQITMYSGFLRKEGEATLDDFMQHLLHAIEVAGIDHVGIGTDFDGDGAITGCSSASQLRNVTRELLRRGFSLHDIEKIWGGNWLRVMRRVQRMAD
ncbi:MAG: gamma-glutamyl-gamma-aminobutyrate hydrolase family protein [Bacteroidaceae bacterium]|nr:gamma-glutamyl-gamma-aminobutyrate hydrolase family protein [Bacteroidaceae bacterium]